MEPKQGCYEGWAILELMGHQREIGFVTTEAYGTAVLFRCDTPELPEREFVLTQPHWTGEGDGQEWTPAGAKVKRASSPARSRLIAPGALYALNPCTEEAARTALEKMVARPLILIEAPPRAALPAPEEECPDMEGDEDEQDDLYDDDPSEYRIG